MKVDQQIRGSSAWNDAQIFPNGVITMDTDLHNLRLHDGSTPGGFVLPNLGSIPAFATLEWTGVSTYSAAGTLPNGAISQLSLFSVANTYTLPALSAGIVGSRLVLLATVAGVIIARNGTDLITDGAADLTSINMVANQVVTLGKQSTARWRVVNRY